MSNKPTPLGDIFLKYEKETNPVTRSVYREIIANRLNRIEASNEITGRMDRPKSTS